MDSIVLIKVLTELIMPPGCIVIGLLLGLSLWRRRPRAAGALVAAATGALYLASTPLVSARLADTLEIYPVVDAARIAAFGAQAIVVLGGGRRLYAPEFDGPTVSTHALARLRYAARLQRQSGLPLAVTGGAVSWPAAAEGTLMARVLREDFQVPVRWVEAASRNTVQNARLTRKMLAAENIQRVVLISHAAHLRRATEMFVDQGFQVLPAPTVIRGSAHSHGVTPGDLLPTATALFRTRLALHEHLGRLWYRLGGAR